MSVHFSSQPAAEPLSQISDTAKVGRQRRIYRPARPLPYELQQHCIAFVGEELYSQAFSLLLSLLLAGTDHVDHENGRLIPAYVPPCQFVALAATLIVHPSVTNRATAPEQVQAANDALFYLIHLNALVGPSGSNFTTAFLFSSAASTRQARRRERTHQEGSPDSEDEHGKLHISLANQGSIWVNAEDFWAVVGWAFNCSVRHPKRWDRWKLWLGFMLDVLDDDLTASIAAAKAKKDSDDGNASEMVMEESLLVRYLAPARDGRTGKRRIMRAILADGGQKSLAEFGEVWKDETKERKAPKEKYVSKKKRLDVAEGDFGDYVDDEEEDEDDRQPSFAQSARRSTRKRANSATNLSDGESTSTNESTPGDFGGADSVSLRQRFMALLVRLCSSHASSYMGAEDLFDLFTEFLRPLPLSIFTQFVLPGVPYLEPHSQASLNQTLLRPLISSHAPTYNAETMTQAGFETHFLPYPANHTNYLENARVSVLVEGLLRLLARYLDLQVTESLRSKLEEGIKARQEKAAFGARRKGGEREAEEELAASLLDSSSARMSMLIMAVACS